MREIKFEIGVKNGDGRVNCVVLTINELLDKGLKCDGEILWKRQFTGLIDKNGVEIYEGDILTLNYDEGFDASDHLVEYGGIEYPAFHLSPDIGAECNDFSHIYNDSSIEIEVIGNTHQNQELLK